MEETVKEETKPVTESLKADTTPLAAERKGTWLGKRFSDLRDAVLRLGNVPAFLFGQELPLAIQKALKKEIEKEKAMKAMPQCFFICIRSGNMLSNKDMSLPHFDSKRWVPVPSKLVKTATAWPAGKRAKWAAWVLRTLLPRLKAQGKQDQLERLALKF